MATPVQKTKPVPQTTPTPFSLSLFGPVQALVEGEPLPRLRSRKSLWLLALLALRNGRPVERTWLAEALWPDAYPDQAAANLNPALSDLRRALGPQAIRLQSPSRHALRLDLTGADVDVVTFDAAIRSQKPDALEQAAALYQGPILEGCTEEWVMPERDAREQDCLRALKTLGESALTDDDPAKASDYFRRALRIAPRWEAAQRGLMLALARGGDGNGALDAYQEFTRLLHREDPKAVPDDTTRALYAQLRAKARQRAATPTVIATEEPLAPLVRGYLPHSLTALVGREDECLQIGALLRRSRLVTLTGPGGIGKTRLAIEVADETAPDYADGVWLVALEALPNGERLAGQVAGALGVKEDVGRPMLESLTDHLRSKRLLLVMDNCEHLLQLCAEIAGHLLWECGGLRILATSREALNITGEAVWAVPGLTVPDLAHLPSGGTTLVRVLAGYESVRLFMERARLVQKTFALSGNNARSVARICAVLEGTPLALELAAARVRSLTVEQIAARLDDSLNLLTSGNRVAPARQQTLRATLDWSFAQLNVLEQLLIGRVSVFVGGWSLAAAETVCAGDGIEAEGVLDLLTSLVDKSLVAYEDRDGVGRYRLLETVRQYAVGRLTEAVRDRHLQWGVSLVEEAAWLRDVKQNHRMSQLETEYSNLTAAMTRAEAVPHGADAGLRLASGLAQFWYEHGLHIEGRQYLVRALGCPSAQEETELRARALNCAGVLSYSHGDFASARTFYVECLSIRRRLGDKSGEAIALNNIGNLDYIHGGLTTAEALHTEALRLFQEIGDARGVAQVTTNLGNVASLRQDFGTAKSRYEQALTVYQEMNDQQSVAMTFGNLGNIAHKQENYGQAWSLHTDALELFQDLGNRAGIARSRMYQGYAILGLADIATAAALLEEALALFRELAEKPGIADALAGLGLVAQKRGEVSVATGLHRQSLRIYQEINHKEGVLEALSRLANAQFSQGEVQQAVRLWGAVEALRERIGTPLPLSEWAKYDQQSSSARVSLGEGAFAMSLAEGRTLAWDQAVTEALEDERGH